MPNTMDQQPSRKKKIQKKAQAAQAKRKKKTKTAKPDIEVTGQGEVTEQEIPFDLPGKPTTESDFDTPALPETKRKAPPKITEPKAKVKPKPAKTWSDAGAVHDLKQKAIDLERKRVKYKSTSDAKAIEMHSEAIKALWAWRALGGPAVGDIVEKEVDKGVKERYLITGYKPSLSDDSTITMFAICLNDCSERTLVYYTGDDGERFKAFGNVFD